MPTVPLFTPVTIAELPVSGWTVAKVAFADDQANTTLGTATVSLPTTRTARARTCNSVPRRRNVRGAPMSTDTFGLSSSGNLHLQPNRGTAQTASQRRRRTQFMRPDLGGGRSQM